MNSCLLVLLFGPLMEQVVPYLIVAGVAILVTIAELLTSFGSGFCLALRTIWAWVLLVANTCFALIVYSITIATLNIGHNPLSAVVCGILFPAILRSRFTFFRAAGDRADSAIKNVSVPLDKLYTGIQKLCYREVDSRQAAHRAVRANELAGRTEEGRLVSAIEQVIAAKRVATEQEADNRYLEELRGMQDPDMRRYLLAMFLIDIGGGREDQLLAAPLRPPAQDHN